jgi:transcriptional regulator with XRE-family HTH domain
MTFSKKNVKFDGMMINNRVIEIRKYLGLTQESFSGRLGIKRSTLANIETNNNPLTEANIKLICHVFAVNEEWLRTGNGEMFQKNQSPLENEVLKMFRELSQEAQLIIRDYIKMVLKQQEALQSLHGESPETAPEAVASREKGHPIHGQERA